MIIILTFSPFFFHFSFFIFHLYQYQPWECEDFLRTWDLETPGSKIPDESLLLNGIAIKVEIKQHKSISTDGSSSYFSYRYLPFEEMSSNLQVFTLSHLPLFKVIESIIFTLIIYIAYLVLQLDSLFFSN